MNLIATDNKQVIIGLGETGLSCARYLARTNKPFSMVDSREKPPGLDAFKSEFPDVFISLGAIDDAALIGANRIIVSPGVALTEPAIARAIKAGVDVCGDIDLFRAEVTAPIVAITGSNGKSTVTTLLGEMAKRCGKNVAVGGNIGTPVLELLTEKEPDLFVLELSSFQLERAGHLSVEVATVINVSADHMDRYPNVIAYHQAKHRIFFGCNQVVINRADPLSQPLVSEEVKVFTFGLSAPDFNGFGLINHEGDEWLAFEFEILMPVSQLKIVGRHNIENALAALALGKAAGLEMQGMLSALREFSGLEHRCQYIAEINQVRYYNDSKGTNVGAAIAAINGLVDSAEKIILIAGGESKDADFKPLVPVLRQHVRAVVLMGEAAEELENLCSNVVPVIRASAMEQAVQQAMMISQSGDVVLLSPACASFDMFKNYQHRGELFTDAVLDIANQRAS